MEVLTLGASLASIVIAVVAIGLSVKFFQMSSEQAARSTEAAREISASVDRLEQVFEKLYSDTFSMMSQLVQSMSQQVFTSARGGPPTAADVARIRTKLLEQLRVARVPRPLAELSGTILGNEISDTDYAALDAVMYQIKADGVATWEPNSEGRWSGQTVISLSPDSENPSPS